MSSIKPFNSQSQILKPLERTALFVAREIKEAAVNDPALAMRLAATQLVPSITSGVNPDVLVTTNDTIVPVMRAGLLAVNTFRAIRTFKDPTSNLAEKSMDVIRVVSDTAGLIGGLAMLFTPQYAALGAKLMGTAYSVDIVSHAMRGLTHGYDRVKVWQAEAAAAKPDTGSAVPTPPGLAPEPTPAPTPAPKPTSSVLNQPLTVFEQPKQLSLFGA